jgi:hypothetical protein
MIISRRSRSTAAVAAALLAIGMLGGIAAPASAAPMDQVSVSLPRLGPDFGYVKQGSVIPRTIDILNDGVDPITIDPAPLSTLTAPYSLTSTSLVAGEVIAPGQRRTITVTLTAPPAPAMPTQTVTLVAVDHDRPGAVALPLTFAAESLTTERAHFDVAASGGIAPLSFGSVEVGSPVTRQLTLSVLGIDPLSFAEADVKVLDTSGTPVPSMRVSASSFGGGKTTPPRGRATVDITFLPTGAGALSGTIVITGRPMNGNPEALGVTQVIPFTASATAVVVPPTPTPTATPVPQPPVVSPGSVVGGGTATTPGTGSGSAITGTGAAAAGRGSAAGTGSAAGARSLANTGADALAAAWFVGLTLFAGAVAIAGAWRMRRRTR